MVFVDWLQGWKNRWLGWTTAVRARLRIRQRQALAPGIEHLEQRVVLSGAQSGTYDVVAPQWFDVIGPAIADTTPQSAGASQSTGSEWIIRLTPDAVAASTSVEDSQNWLNSGELTFQVVKGLGLPGQLLVQANGGADSAVSAALQANPYVAYFEQNSTVFATALPNDPKISQQTELQRIGAAGAWQTQTSSSPLVVAVIDSGIDYTSPDLYLNIWLNQGEIPASMLGSLRDTNADGLINFRDLNDPLNKNTGLLSDRNHNGYIDAGDLLQDPAWMDHVDGDSNGKADDLIGWDFTDNDAAPLDENGHGTHVSGILAATGDNGLGIAGVNWAAQIMVVKFLDQRLHGEATDAISALNYVTQFRQSRVNGQATAPDVRISNNSWEIRPSQSSSTQSLNDAIIANANSGMLLIAAAGNGVGEVPQNLDTDPFASLPAANPSLSIVSVAAVDASDQLLVNSNFGATTVDLAAPGLDIFSTEPGGNYGTRTGTSMATPFVSGAAALFWAKFPEATAAEVRQALLNGVDAVPSLTGKVATGGRLNIQKTLGFDTIAPRATLTTAADITATGGTFQTVVVNYTDNVIVNWSTLNAADIVVTRADGQPFNPAITLQSTTVTTNAPQISATYRIAAPNGKWTNADNGVYEIRWVADQVADGVANKNRATLLGTFRINIPAPDDLRVTSFVDSPDQSIGDGLIADSQGRATLRAAIQEANFDPDANTIKLGAGTYTLTIGGANEDGSATGDLDLRQNVTIVGISTASTIIDAGQLDRIFHVLPGVTVTLKNLTLRNGKATDGKGGGGILNEGFLTLDQVLVTNNTATTGGGGGLLNNVTTASSSDTLTIIDSTFSNNTATGADGGGVKVLKGKASIFDSTFNNNTAGQSGGGLSVQANTVTATNSTFSANFAGTVGGGLQANGGVLALTNVTVTLNTASTAGGGLSRTAPGSVRLVNTILAGNVLTAAGTDVDVSGAITPTGSSNNFIGIVGTATGFSTGRGDLMGTAASPLNANLAPLANYGGATSTHRPNEHSAVIDAGVDVAGLATDQRNFSRSVDGDNSGTATPDIGAVEFVLYGMISGTAYNDNNQNGTFDPLEQPLAGWTIFLDANNNQLLDNGERSTVTGSDGKYLFTNVLPGNYIVSQVLKVTSAQGDLPTIVEDLENFDSLESPANATPQAIAQSLATNEDTGKQIVLTGDDGDPEVTQVLTFAIVSQPSHGTLSNFNPNTGAVTYTPHQDYNGPDSFQFSVTDDASAGGPAATSIAGTISLTVNPVNDVPTANAQSVTNTGSSRSITLTGSDGDPVISQTLTFAITAQPLHGSVTLNASTGAVTYTPAGGYQGSDSFTFTVTDDATAGGAALTSAAATVTLIGTEQNSPPVANAQSPSVTEDTPKSITLTGDDGDPEVTQTLTFAITQQPLHGTLSGFNASTGAVIYTPAPNYAGPDSFQFTVTDDNTAGSPAQTSPVATVSLTVNGVNDRPVANPQILTNSGSARTITLTGVDGDAEVTQSLTFAIVSGPSHGTLTGLNPSTGAVTYTPTAGYSDADSFTFTVTDDTTAGGAALTSIAVTVTLKAAEINLPPVAYPQTVALSPFSGQANYFTMDLTGDDGNPNSGQSLTFSILKQPAHGVIASFDRSTGRMGFIMSGDGAFDDSFTFTVTDDSSLIGPALTSEPVTVTLTSDFQNAPTFVIAADLNGDGSPDMVTANNSGTGVSVLLGNGDGTFQAKNEFDTGASSTSVVAADVNGDGRLDLVTTNRYVASVSVLLGNGDGTFRPKQFYSTEAGPISVAVVDVNGDGDVDLVTANNGNSSISVLLGDGTGAFQTQAPIPTGSAPTAIAVADLNGDNKPDVVTVHYDDNVATVLLGHGDGTFSRGFTDLNSNGMRDGNEPFFPDYATGSAPVAVAIADVNGDSKLDLVTANSAGNSVSVLLGNNNGTFQSHQDYATGAGPTSVVVTNVSGDAKPEIITSNATANTTSVLVGTGTGSFPTKLDLTTGQGPQSVYVADLNGDGKPDLITANPTPNSVSVLLHANGSNFFPRQDYLVRTANLPPTARDRELTVLGGSGANQITATLLGEDGDPGIIQTLTYAIVSQPKHGTLIMFDAATGNFTYTPTAGYLGEDEFTYTVSDDATAGAPARTSAPGTVSIAVMVPGYNDDPTVVVVGDLNGDGNKDLVTSSETAGTITVLLGNGNGTFQPKREYDGGYYAQALTLRDLNGDTYLDIIVPDLAGSSIMVLMGNGDGTFQARQSYPTGYYPLSVDLLDINGDTKLDLVTVRTYEGKVSTLLGNGDGTFQAYREFDVGSSPRPPKIIDLNGDGKWDLVTPNAGDNTVSVLLGKGDGTFHPKRDFETGITPIEVQVIDVSGDGKLDVITANYHGTNVSVLLGNGNGTFQANQDFEAGNDISTVKVRDLNGDGKLDLVAIANGSSGVVALLGNGDGTFGTAQTSLAGTRPNSFEFADVNGDSKIDIIAFGVNDAYQTSVSVLLGNGTAVFTNLEDRAIEDPSRFFVLSDLNKDARLDLISVSGESRNVSVLSGQANGTFLPAQTVQLGKINHQPVATDFSVTLLENEGPREIFLQGDDGESSLDQRLTYYISSGSRLHGIVSEFDPHTGRFVYTPDLNFDGVEFISYYVVDDRAINGFWNASPVRTLTLNVQATAGNYQPRFVVMGDVNGDQILDTVTANGTTNNVTVLLGNGDGTYLPKRDFATGNDPRAVAIGDVNRDGWNDLVTTNYADATVSVLLGKGDGTFQPAKDYPIGDAPVAMALADVNGDGKLDWVTANSGPFSNSVSVGLGIGNGTFQAAQEYMTGNAPQSVLAIDVNGDGKLDLVTASGENNSISVLLGNGNGTFAAKHDYASSVLSPNPRSLSAADVNEDGKVDLVTASFDTGRINLFLGGGDGSFQAVDEFELFADGIAGSVSVTLADVNGDGHADLVSSRGQFDEIGVRLGVGNGTFQRVQTYTTGDDVQSVVVADVDANGSHDLVAVNLAGQSVSVRLGNGDGTFGRRSDYSVAEAFAYQSVVTANPDHLVSVNGTLYFTADDPLNGTELWVSNGTKTTTLLAKDIFVGSADSNPQWLVSVNGLVYFAANDGTRGAELWRSDGTLDGTSRVKDIQNGAIGSNPSWLTNVNGILFFVATDSAGGTELWKSDGTSVGTVRVKDIVSGTGSSNPAFLTNVNGTLFFTATDAAGGTELWKSDGTVAGTVRVKDIVAGAGASNPMWLTNVNGILYFVANDGASGAELWRSDGSLAGTILLKDLVGGSGSSNPALLTNFNGKVAFTATDGSGTELWISDGTANGTVMIKDILTGSGSANPRSLTVVNNILFFTATDAAGGTELWRSDGTLANTFRVKDIVAGSAGSNPTSLTEANGTLFFTADDGVGGRELWKSDGTSGGTYALRDIQNGPRGSFPSSLTNANGLLYFSAFDASAGWELWESDGTFFGTVKVSAAGNQPPTDLMLSSTTITENNQSGETVGSFNIVDPDAGDVFTYSFVNGIGSDDNSSFTVIGGALMIIPVTNAATKSTYAFRVRVTDQGGLSLEKTFVITVTPAPGFAPPGSPPPQSFGAPSAPGANPSVPDLPLGWTTTGTVPWVTVTGGSGSSPNHAFIANSAAASDSSLTSPVITVARQGLQLKFQNSYETESGHDGGVLEVAVNGGEFVDIITAGGSFVSGGYGATITNGRNAWTGNSNGYVTTLVNLPAYGMGSTLQFRWRFVSDASNGMTGWSVDTIQLLGKQPAWIETSPNPNQPTLGRYTLTVAPGSTNADLNFGNYARPGEIRGTLFLDANRDGIQAGASEIALPGWTVYLDQNNNRVQDPGEPFRITAADGSYTFANLDALVRQNVTALLPPGWEPTTFSSTESGSALTHQQGFTLVDAMPNHKLGTSVSAAGDVNGDGYDDFLVARPAAGSDFSPAAFPLSAYGYTYVVFGGAGGLPANFNLGTLNGTDGFAVLSRDSATNSNASGSSVAGAGDINGDGYADLLIGAPLSDLNGTQSGATYVIFGKPAGFSATIDVSNPSTLNGSNGFVIRGIGDFDALGSAVSGVGDVNDDGFDDFVVTAPGVNADRAAGAAYLIFGRNTNTTPFTSIFDLSSLNGTNGVRLDGADADRLGNEISGNGLPAGGQSVAAAGDVNGDGIDDLIIGAKTGMVPVGNGTERRGKAYVVFGKTTGWGSSLTLSTLTGTNGFAIRGAAKDDEFGISVAGVGDFNGDTFDDIVIGADHADPHGANSGASYVIYGRSAAQTGAFAPFISVAALDGTNGFRISGVASGDAVGTAVGGAGDINGDGLADLLIGADHVDATLPTPTVDVGAVYFVFGSRSNFGSNFELSALDGQNGYRLTGTIANSGTGAAVSGIGDFNGDGLGDVFIGGNPFNGTSDPQGTNTFYLNNVYLIYGRGDNRQPITLDAAEPRADVDFPVRPKTGEISGQVFDDKNRNGVRDAGEPGVAGITLLLDIHPNNARDNDEPVAVTDADGRYTFTNLSVFVDLAHPTQTYRVIELVSVNRLDLTQSFPQKLIGVVDVTPFASSSKLRTGYDIAVDGKGGFLLTGTAGTDSGFNQQDVLRVSANGQSVDYFAVADHPQGVTSDGVYAYWVDLDADGTHTRIYRQLLSGGTRELVYSAQLQTGGSGKIISGTGLDLVPGAGPGVPASLLTIDGLLGAVSRLPARTNVSDADVSPVGAAQIAGLLDQSHAQFVDEEQGVVYVVDPGFVSTSANQSLNLPARILSIPLSGGTYTVLYTGNLPGLNFFDTTISGSRPRGIAVHGGTIYLTGQQAVYALPITGGTPVAIAADERFRDLGGLAYSDNRLFVIDNGTANGATIWRVDLAPSLARSIDVDVSSNERSWNVTLGPGTNAAGFDFARFDPNAAIGAGGSQSIRGTVFTDQNNNGIQDGNETGRVGVRVFLDLNRNGVLDAGDVVTQTVAGDVPGTTRVELPGEYLFTGLQPGLYDVLLADSGLAVTLTTSSEVTLSATDLIDPTKTSTGTPRAVAVGDWNNDGLNDLVVADSETGKITLWKNTGDQHFVNTNEFNQPYEFTVEGIPNSVTLINLNGDSLPDLAIGQAQYSSLSLWTNLGNGRFEQKMTTGGLPQVLALKAKTAEPIDYGVPGTVVAADFNHDSRMDLAVVDSHPDYTRVFVFLRNAADFSFAAPQILTTPGTVKGLVAANLVGSNAIDLAATIPSRDQLLVWSNLDNGSASLFGTAQVIPVGDGPTALTVLQADGAGGLDLAVANTAAGTISILANGGNGNWNLLSTLALTAPPTGLQAADIDGANGPDLVVTLGDGTDSSQPLVVFYHAGDNTQPYNQAVAYGASIFDFTAVKTGTGVVVSAANLDLDNDPDLVVVNSAAKTVSVLRNGPTRSGHTVRLTANGSAASATDINFGIGSVPLVSFNPATGQLTIALSLASEIELGSVGGQVELRVQGVVDESLHVASADVASIVIQGSSGVDRIDLSRVSVGQGFTHAGGVTVTVDGNAGADNITGSEFADHLNGGDGQDIVDGRGGNDTLTGGLDDDFLYGGDGNDSLDGQGGANRLDGGSGVNTLLGGTVNEIPVFTAGSDQQVVSGSGPRTITGWATNISAGPPNESGQLVNFIVSNNNNALFSVQPAVSATGTLTFTLAAGAQGTASVTVQIHDNGGTANGGVDTSPAQTFQINVTVDTGAPQLQSAGPAVTWIKKQPPVTVTPLIAVSGGNSLGGGTLTIDSTSVGKKKSLDTFALSAFGSIGTSTGAKFANGHTTLVVQLKADVTAAAIQAFLRGIKFSTKGGGLKVPTRTVSITLTDSSQRSATASQTINVRAR